MKTRTEKEMMDLIHQFVESDDRIRVAILNGSRANPNIQKDIFQDYDIACFVIDIKPYLNENDVVPYFGETIIYEQPNFGPWPPDDMDGSYHNYNMQFIDGNRIDLTFLHIDELHEVSSDSLSKILIDKDSLCSHLPQSSEKSYYISEPTAELFKGCCDAFLFAIGSHIPKTIWRKQLPQLKSYTEGWLRVPMQLMLSWEIGLKRGFDNTIGAGGRHLPKLLGPEKWERYLDTYVDSDLNNIWNSIFVFYDMFVESATFVADEYGFIFPEESAGKVFSFLKHVNEISDDADSIY